VVRERVAAVKNFSAVAAKFFPSVVQSNVIREVVAVSKPCPTLAALVRLVYPTDVQVFVEVPLLAEGFTTALTRVQLLLRVLAAQVHLQLKEGIKGLLAVLGRTDHISLFALPSLHVQQHVLHFLELSAAALAHRPDGIRLSLSSGIHISSRRGRIPKLPSHSSCFWQVGQGVVIQALHTLMPEETRAPAKRLVAHLAHVSAVAVLASVVLQHGALGPELLYAVLRQAGDGGPAAFQGRVWVEWTVLGMQADLPTKGKGDGTERAFTIHATLTMTQQVGSGGKPFCTLIAEVVLLFQMLLANMPQLAELARKRGPAQVTQDALLGRFVLPFLLGRGVLVEVAEQVAHLGSTVVT
jgi:hypothetical protein